METKTCTRCKLVKELDKFHRESSSKDGRRGDCKDCLRKRQREAYDSGKNSEAYLKSKNECLCGNKKSRYAQKCQNCARPKHDDNNLNWRKDSQGYVVASSPVKEIRQHRWVMERYLGRALLPHENVHHKNGVRDDNRIENLELWSTAQPSGQRVEEKLEWCRWFLSQYRESKT